MLRSSGVSTICTHMARVTNSPKGLHIYMGGVGLQQLFIVFFVGLAIRFQLQMKRETPMQDLPRAMRLLYALYAVLTLITVSRSRHPSTIEFTNASPRSVSSFA